MTALYCYDNEIIKWTYGDNLYCLHIQRDNEADNNPRWWYDHDSVMAVSILDTIWAIRLMQKHRKSFGITWFTNIVMMMKFLMRFLI